MAKSLAQFARQLLSAEVVGHPIVWSATTGLFILAGYVWLQQFSPTSTPSGTNKGNDSVGQSQTSKWNPDIYREIETLDNMDLSNSLDDPRALEYRHIVSIETKITPLLTTASQLMKEGRFAAEGQELAWAVYQQILTIDPDNTTAKLGSNEILTTLQSQVNQTIQSRQYEDAESWLAQLDLIQPNATYQEDSRTLISAQIQQDLEEQARQQAKRERLKRLKTALDQAHAVFNADKPEPRAAYDLYQLALEIDPNNPSALSGIRKIKRFYTKKVSLFIAQKDFPAARRTLDRLRELDGNPADIQSLSLKLVNQEIKYQAIAKAKQDALNKAELARKELTNRLLDIPKKPLLVTKNAQTQVPSNAVAVDAIDINEIRSTQINPVLSNEESRTAQLKKGINAYYAGNYNDAFEWLHPLAEDGVARAQFRIGIMYFQGRTVVKNQDLAAQWISKSLPTILRAAQGNQAWAQSDLGTGYELGIALKKDMSRAASWYQKAADNGYAGAQTNLGVLYGMGDGVQYDRQLAVYWLKKAAAQGDKIAQDNLDILEAR